MKNIFLTVSEIAAMGNCSVSTIRRAADAGSLMMFSAGKLRGPHGGGRERLFLRMDVERFLAERRKARRRRGKQRKVGDQL
jgi:hypothetical protein